MHAVSRRLIATTAALTIVAGAGSALTGSAQASASRQAAPTVSKVTSYAYLSTLRKGSAVYVNALVKQSSPAGIIRSPRRTVFLQRQLGSNWQSMLSPQTDSKGVFAVGFVSVPAYHYRLVVTANTAALGTTSGIATSVPQVVRYANCAAVHAVPTYAHGIGRPGAVDHVSGSTTPVTGFFVNSALYQANAASLDRDHDGIACEQA